MGQEWIEIDNSIWDYDANDDFIWVQDASSGYANDVNGVLAANIGKINGVATADIAKVNGV